VLAELPDSTEPIGNLHASFIGVVHPSTRP
jgi:hypothetical protein